MLSELSWSLKETWTGNPPDRSRDYPPVRLTLTNTRVHGLRDYVFAPKG